MEDKRRKAEDSISELLDRSRLQPMKIKDLKMKVNKRYRKNRIAQEEVSVLLKLYSRLHEKSIL